MKVLAMTPNHLANDSTIDSDSNSDVPESFSLSDAKKSAKRKNEEIEHVHAALRKKSKLKNQERDRLLKEQALRRKEKGMYIEKGKEKEKDGDNVMVRMERAMREAREEGDRDGAEEDEEEWAGLGSAEDDEEDEEDKDSSDAAKDDDDTDEDNDEETNEHNRRHTSDLLSKKSSNHLPDHLFEAAFAAQNAQLVDALKSTPTTTTSEKPRKSKKQAALTASTTRPQKKRKRQSKDSDMVVGSRTIRTLSFTSRTSKDGAYAPRREVQKYIDKRLAIKGGSSRVRGWMRRPANIGIMRQNGPAANFVRS